jgi:hypothetical protein
LARISVGNDADTINRAVCFKHGSNRILSSAKTQIPYKNIFHFYFLFLSCGANRGRAIMGNQLSTGIGYRHGRWRLDLAYGFDPTAQENVGKAALLSGEYANSKVRIGTQSLGLNTSFQF